MKTATILLTFMWIVINAAASSAVAASITNLSSQAQTIELKMASGYTSISIGSGQVFRVMAAMRVKVDGREVYIDDNEEYALWNNGVFGPQKINHINGR